MFDIGGWELLFLMVIALIVVGPKASFEEMARQAELDEIKKEVGDIAGGKDLKNLQQQINQSVDNMIGTPKPLDTKGGYHPPEEDAVAPEKTSPDSESPSPQQNTGAAG